MRAVRALRRGIRLGGRYAAASPFSVLVALVVLTAGAVFTAPRTEAVRILAAGPVTTAHEHLWWTPVTALLVPGSLLDAVLSAALALTVLAYTERAVGTARTVLAYFGVGAVAILAGIGVHMLTIWSGVPVLLLAVPSLTLDPATGLFGAFMAGSAAVPVLFRRRIRVIGLAVALTFALYGGTQDAAYRLIAALLGLGLGAVLHRRVADGPAERGRRARAVAAAGPVRGRSSYAEVRTLVAAVVAVTGIGPIVVIVSRTVYGPLALVASGYLRIDRGEAFERCAGYFSSDCDAGSLQFVAHGVAAVVLGLVPVVLSLIAAWGLHAGRRAAWVLAVAVNAVDLAVTLAGVGVAGLLTAAGAARAGERFVLAAVLAVGVPIAVLTVLVVTRRRFAVRAGRGAVRVFCTTVGIAAAVVVATGVVVFAVTGELSVPLDLREIVRHILGVTLPAQLVHGITRIHRGTDPALAAVVEWIGVAFWAVLAIALARLVRGIRRHGASPQAARFRQLLRDPGADTLSFMGTWAGNAHWVAPDRRGALAYRVEGSVALVVADPACAQADLPAVLDGFIAFCDEHALTPVFYSIHEQTLAPLRDRGWSSTPVGEETVVALAGLELSGGGWKRVRQALAKGEREQLATQWTSWSRLPAGMAAQIEALSEHWVAEKALPEMGFTLGGLAELRDPDAAILLAVDADGRLQAVTSWLPGWQAGRLHSWTLDFMRRADEAMPEIMVYLIASAAIRMRDDGVAEMSLSGAPLARKPDAPGGGSLVDRLLDWLGEVLEPVYGFRSLFAFKQKFHPQLRTVWMAYEDAADLIAIGRAITRAYLPTASPRQVVELVRMLTTGRGDQRVR